jgi:hypothetical protein
VLKKASAYFDIMWQLSFCSSPQTVVQKQTVQIQSIALRFKMLVSHSFVIQEYGVGLLQGEAPCLNSLIVDSHQPRASFVSEEFSSGYFKNVQQAISKYAFLLKVDTVKIISLKIYNFGIFLCDIFNNNVIMQHYDR